MQSKRKDLTVYIFYQSVFETRLQNYQLLIHLRTMFRDFLFKIGDTDERAADRFNHVDKRTEGKNDMEDDAAPKEALRQNLAC